MLLLELALSSVSTQLLSVTHPFNNETVFELTLNENYSREVWAAFRQARNPALVKASFQPPPKKGGGVGTKCPKVVLLTQVIQDKIGRASGRERV